MFSQHDVRRTFLLIVILLVHIEGSHGQLAQWIAPYLPVAPGEPADSSTLGLEYRQREVLNDASGTIIKWSVDRSSKSSLQSIITFKFTTRLNSESGGYIILGLSRRGNVEGADVVLVNLANGQGELVDMHGTDNSTISIDANQNWNLHEVIRNSAGDNSSVSVIVSRDLDTCDAEHDIPINNDMLHVIWGSSSNTLSWDPRSSPIQFTPKGSVRTYLADPVRTSVTNTRKGSNKQQTWRISRSLQLPSRHTSYWCTIHKGLPLPTRHHIIGYAAYFANSTSERHVHHQVVYRCIAPPGVDPALIFQRYVNHPGEECYLEQRHQLPTHLCLELIHTWGVGGKPFTFPQNLGISIGETQNEYFMFESHYDNPEMRSDIVIENGVDFFYTSEIRPVEGGILFMGSGVLGLLEVPPNSPTFNIGGQCSSQCTTEMLAGIGGGGMDIMATMLHGHTTAHKIRVKHYRGGKELPWIQTDDNYDFNFQQVRHLSRPAKILPGDSVGVECVLDTTSRNTTTLSGFSTRDEMCVSFVVVNKRLGYLYCSSEYPTNRTLDRYGIQNITWDRELQERVINQASNTELVGQPLQRVIDAENLEQWTPERRRDLQNEQFYGTHSSMCPPVRKMGLLAYAVSVAEGLTKGLLNLQERVDRNRPSTNTVSTPALDVTLTEWPRPLLEYRPTSTCRA